ncbi:MAG: S49 family peptidase [Alphaproteobacteria bacterium]|nr:S49 family peptidase [Alphaproteobacteria bacterium]MCB9696326.1 S49 family peptidase [Alphaproteobacteria bacterium]
MSSVLGALALLPRVALRGLHRGLTGQQAVLDVTVERMPDLMQRDRFLRRLGGVVDDARVVAVVLRLHAPPAGWAALQDLVDVIRRIRESGRKVYAWLEAPGNAVMAIAAACDHVFVVPTGEVGLVGVGTELTFFGAALGRMGIRPDFEAAGAYKSFGEPWTRSFPSPANQEAVRELVEDLHHQLVVAIADGRGQAVDEVHAVLARAPLSAEEAKLAGLVDDLLYEDQLETWLEEAHGSKAHLVSFRGWALRELAVERLGRLGAKGPTVAVLHLQGPITLEERSGAFSIVAREVLPVLRRLKEDDDVAAVVLHVDSPGGSALASDLMWREVVEIKRQKPVVAAFEDVAASGGFYLSAAANAIVARPGTLTGSIGVFGGKLVMSEGLRKVGVHTQEVLAAPNANLYSAVRHFTDDQRVRFRASLQRFYDGFVGRVAEGRGKPVEEVEPFCRGRVWTGRAALEHGLVDETRPGLEGAIDRARGLAQLPVDRYVRHDLAGQHDPLWTRMLQGLVRQVLPVATTRVGALRWAERLLAPGLALADVVVAHPNQPIAMLPFELEVR